jgi:hypothetical protein
VPQSLSLVMSRSINVVAWRPRCPHGCSDGLLPVGAWSAGMEPSCRGSVPGKSLNLRLMP